MSYSGKGKGKEVADKDPSFGGKRKRDKDDDKTGRNGKNRAVLQFFDDEAGEYESSDDSIFGNANLDDLFGSDTETKAEPEKVQFVPFLPKEEEMSEEELDKMLAERYKSGSGAVSYAEDSHKMQRSAHIDFTFPSGKDPIIWKIKCAVGRERHSVFCLMQKYTELRTLGTKLQVISAVSLDHVKGFIFVEAEKQADVNEACKGLCSIYLSRTSKIAMNEMSQLFSTRNKPNLNSEGSWARVKSGTYKGDLAQVVAVNDARKRITVKLIPRIDLQNLALKFGGGGAPKKTTIPPPRLIGLAELEEFRPLIQFRRDRDTDLTFQVIDGLMLKDGYIYKKVPLDSLNFSGVNPSEDEILKFNSSEKSESNDLEWLSQLYGGRDKKRPVKSIKKSDKGGGKGEGSSSSPSLPNGYEIYDLACFGRKDFGIILGFEKDNCKILKDAPEGPVVVTVDPNQLTTALSDTKFSALDQNKKTLSPGDTIKVVEGPSQGRQGIVKHIYRGVLFLTDDAEENDGYFCAKSFMCEKVKLVDDTFQPDEGGASGFADYPSSPKSHMPRERNRDFERGDKDGMFSIGQTLRIRVGPLKGYLCRVLAIRYSDITVKLNSQTKIYTVKSEHLSEVRKNTTIGSCDNLDSNPAATGNLDSSGDWMNGTGTSTESNGLNVGGLSERTGWPSFPAADVAASDQGRETNSSSWDNHSKNDADGWKGGSGTETTQNSSWGGWGQKKPEIGEASGSASVQAAAPLQDVGGWGSGTGTTHNSSWGGWGQKKPENGAVSGYASVQAVAPLQGAAGWENNKTTNPASEWGGWGQKKPDNNERKDAEASWGNDAGPSSDTQKDDIASWGNKTSGNQNTAWGGWDQKADVSGGRDAIGATGSTLGEAAMPSEGGNSGWEIKKSTSHSSAWGQKTQDASGSWGKTADVPSNSSGGAECATNWENKKATPQTSWGAWGEKKSAQEESDSGGAPVMENNVKSGFDALGGGNNWSTPKPVGGESSWKKETGKEDSVSVWGKMKNVSETPSVAWGSEKKTVQDAPSWGGGGSSQQTGGWNKPSSGKSMDERFNESKVISELDAPGGENSWNKTKTFGGPSWNKETEQQDSASAWGKKKDVAENPSSGWGAQKSTAQNVSGWGDGGSIERTDSWKKPNVSSNDQKACWNKQGANSSWGQHGSESSWHKSGLQQDGQDTKSFDRESGSRFGRGRGRDQPGWRGRGRDQQGGRSFGGGSSSEWSNDGDNSGWKSDVGGGWGQSSNFGGRSNTSWNSDSPKDDSINNEPGGRGRFDRGGFRGRGRSERGGFRGRGSFERGGSRGGFNGNRGGFGSRDRDSEGNGGGWKDRDSFEQKSWNNETSSSSKAGWSKEGDSQTGGSSEWKSWSSGRANAVGSQPSGWSGGASLNSASGSKGAEGSNTQASSWGKSKNDETGEWKSNSTSNDGWSREPVKETFVSSVEASAGVSQSTGWGSGGTGWSRGGGMNEDGGSNAQTGNGSWK